MRGWAPFPEQRPRTVADPELPDDKEERLFFTMINCDVSSITELKRITQLEMEGCIDKEGLKEFTKARLKSSDCAATDSALETRTFNPFPPDPENDGLVSLFLTHPDTLRRKGKPEITVWSDLVPLTKGGRALKQLHVKQGEPKNDGVVPL